MIPARSCSLTAVADMPAPLLGQSFHTIHERLRDTYRNAGAKAGKQRDISRLCRASRLEVFKSHRETHLETGMYSPDFKRFPAIISWSEYAIN
jgi:hypothetical protein